MERTTAAGDRFSVRQRLSDRQASPAVFFCFFARFPRPWIFAGIRVFLRAGLAADGVLCYNGRHAKAVVDLLDLLVTGGWLIDPERLEMRPGSIGVKDGRIAGVYGADARAPEALSRIDAEGAAVCPGFIDVHSHLDGQEECGRRALLQGITTSFGGNCGLSPVDMDAFFESQRGGYCVNQCEFVGHSFTLREAVGLKDTGACADLDQLGRMESMARRAMDAGAWGVSFGLDYCPGCAFREVETLGRLTAEYGGICPVHTRLFTMYDMYSIAEAARLAVIAGVQVQVSHLVYQYPMNELLDDAFEMIEFAHDRGARICCDSGMYTNFAAPLGSATFDPENMEACDWQYDHLLVSTGEYRGMRMDEALYRRLRREAPETEVICFSGDERAVEHAFSRDYVMISTDAGAYQPGQGHPQAAASFPRFFRIMARERKRLSWPEAVRRATLLPAETMGLKTKGRLREGMDADLVVFDPRTISERADFAGMGEPDAPPEGIRAVILGGQLAAQDSRVVNARLGRTIRRERSR